MIVLSMGGVVEQFEWIKHTTFVPTITSYDSNEQNEVCQITRS